MTVSRKSLICYFGTKNSFRVYCSFFASSDELLSSKLFKKKKEIHFSFTAGKKILDALVKQVSTTTTSI